MAEKDYSTKRHLIEFSHCVALCMVCQPEDISDNNANLYVIDDGTKQRLDPMVAEYEDIIAQAKRMERMIRELLSGDEQAE